MQSNNKLRPFSTNTTNIYSDSDIATLSVIGTGAVNNAIADSKLYNSLSATTTLACTALIDFVAAQNPSVNFGQTLPIDNWISSINNSFNKRTYKHLITIMSPSTTTEGTRFTFIITNTNSTAYTDANDIFNAIKNCYYPSSFISDFYSTIPVVGTYMLGDMSPTDLSFITYLNIGQSDNQNKFTLLGVYYYISDNQIKSNVAQITLLTDDINSNFVIRDVVSPLEGI